MPTDAARFRENSIVASIVQEDCITEDGAAAKLNIVPTALRTFNRENFRKEVRPYQLSGLNMIVGHIYLQKAWFSVSDQRELMWDARTSTASFRFVVQRPLHPVG